MKLWNFGRAFELNKIFAIYRVIPPMTTTTDNNRQSVSQLMNAMEGGVIRFPDSICYMENHRETNVDWSALAAKVEADTLRLRNCIAVGWDNAPVIQHLSMSACETAESFMKYVLAGNVQQSLSFENNPLTFDEFLEMSTVMSKITYRWNYQHIFKTGKIYGARRHGINLSKMRSDIWTDCPFEFQQQLIERGIDKKAFRE